MEKYEYDLNQKFYECDKMEAIALIGTIVDHHARGKIYIEGIYLDHFFHLIYPDGFHVMVGCNEIVEYVVRERENKVLVEKDLYNKIFEEKEGGYIDGGLSSYGIAFAYGGTKSMFDNDKGINIDNRQVIWDWNSCDCELEIGGSAVGYGYCHTYEIDDNAPLGARIISSGTEIELDKQEWVKYEDMLTYSLYHVIKKFNDLFKIEGDVYFAENKFGFIFWSPEGEYAWRFDDKLFNDDGFNEKYFIYRGKIQVPMTPKKAGKAKGEVRGYNKNAMNLPKNADLMPMKEVMEKIMVYYYPLITKVFEKSVKEKEEDFFTK